MEAISAERAAFIAQEILDRPAKLVMPGTVKVEEDLMKLTRAEQRIWAVEDKLEVGQFAPQIPGDLGCGRTWVASAEVALKGSVEGCQI